MDDLVEGALESLKDAQGALEQLLRSLRSVETVPPMTAEILTGLRELAVIGREERLTDPVVRAALDWIAGLR